MHSRHHLHPVAVVHSHVATRLQPDEARVQPHKLLLHAHSQCKVHAGKRLQRITARGTGDVDTIVDGQQPPQQRRLTHTHEHDVTCQPTAAGSATRTAVRAATATRTDAVLKGGGRQESARCSALTFIGLSASTAPAAGGASTASLRSSALISLRASIASSRRSSSIAAILRSFAAAMSDLIYTHSTVSGA